MLPFEKDTVLHLFVIHSLSVFRPSVVCSLTFDPFALLLSNSDLSWRIYDAIIYLNSYLQKEYFFYFRTN